ncbi:MAG: hypothetical protein L0I92_08650 [Staphylococcus equorum]|nr:hypothetical protein [Staphylococcus equorum]
MSNVYYIFNCVTYEQKAMTTRELSIYLGIDSNSIHRTCGQLKGQESKCYSKDNIHVFIEKPNIKTKKRIIYALEYEHEKWYQTEIEDIMISSCGRIWDKRNNGYNQILIPTINSQRAIISKNSRRVNIRRLAYETFRNTEVSKDMYVVSYNDIRTDIRPENLGIVRDLNTYGLKKARQVRRRPVAYIDEDGQVVEEFKSIKEAAKELLCNKETIRNICNGKQSGIITFGYKNAVMYTE